MFKVVFLQLGNEQGAYDLFMQIGEYFREFQYQVADFASSVFGIFGF